MKIKTISAIWCPSCLLMKNRWRKIEKEYFNIVFEEYDYDENEELCKEFQIGTKLPVTIFFKNDKEIGRLIGEKTEKELIEKIEELI